MCTLRRGNDLLIELPRTLIAAFDSLFDLQERMLNMSWVLLISEVRREVLLRQVAPEPGEVPRQKRHDDE